MFSRSYRTDHSGDEVPPGRDTHGPASSGPEMLLALQRTAGNAAVAAFVSGHVPRAQPATADDSLVLQRYKDFTMKAFWGKTRVMGFGPMRVTAGGLFAVKQNGTAGSVFVAVRKTGEPLAGIAAALKPTGDMLETELGWFREYSLGQPVLKDCLHVAEEIINNQVGGFEWGTDIHSSIRTKTTKRTRSEVFGEDDETNIDRAKRFDGFTDAAATPGVGQAFVIVATNPGGDTEMTTPFHAGAVVGRDGDDCVVLEIDSSNKTPPGEGHPDAGIYTVGHLTQSFHGTHGKQFKNVGPVTIVITAPPK